MDKKIRTSIDKLSYEQMFEIRRCSHVGHPYFQKGEIGDYFQKVMNSKGSKLTQEQKVRISKKIGWYYER